MTDHAPPKVAITSVSDVAATGTASDKIAIAEVACKIDGGIYTAATLSPASGGKSVSWSFPITAGAGKHTLTARAKDSSGNIATTSITFTVTSKSVVISAPAAAATVAGLMVVQGTAVGDWLEVDVTVDGGTTWVRATGTGAWSVPIDTTRIADGALTIQARATDSTGATTTASRSVTVANGAAVEPAAIAGLGYSVVFSDDFATLDAHPDGALDDTKKWGHLWDTADLWPAGSVFVQDSILHIQSRAADGYPPISLATRRATQGGSDAWTYGYFEASLRQPVGIGTYPQFWLLSLLHTFGTNDCSAIPPYTDGTANKLLTAEIDIVEGGWEQGGWGVSGVQQYNTTLHKNTASPCGVPDTFLTHFDTATYVAGGFHTYGMLWTPTAVKFYVDDVLTASFAPYASTFQPLFLILASHKHTDYPGSVPSVIDTEFDWVKVWQLP